MSAEPNLWVIIAAFNEESVIGSVIAGLKSNEHRLLVVDDCSTDDTSRVAREQGTQVIRHPVNLGQGAALETGRQYALSQGAEYICTFDADGQHSPADVVTMLDAIREQHADLVIGSRFIGHAEALPKSRELTLKLAIFFHRVFYGIDFTDTHNGLRIFSRRAAEQIAIESPRMAHATEILRKAQQLGLKVVECPVTISYSKYSLAKGQSFGSSFAIIKDLILRELFK